MITLDVTVDNPNGIGGLIAGVTTQVPYATALAINNTLKDAQTAIRSTLPGHFTLRRATFIENTIKINRSDFATKDNLVGTVRVDPERDFLAKFEEGGAKRAQSGRTMPVPILREENKSLIIRRGDPMSVAMLLASINRAGGRVLRPRFGKGGTVRAVAQPNKVFITTNAKGTFILERLGEGSRNNRVLYWFKPSVPIPADLQFDETALATALAKFDGNFAEALDRAILTGR